MLRFLYSTLLLLLLVSCATTKNREQQRQLLSYVKQGQYDQALQLTQQKNFFSDEQSRLLKLMDIGAVLYLKGDYYQALKKFDQADDLSQKLFTKSIKGKIKAALVNSNVDKYYGERYERSGVKFYQALCHYMLYQQGEYEAHQRIIPYEKNGKRLEKIEEVAAKKLSFKERRFHLLAARAAILSWDALLESYRAVLGGEATYKDDLVAKVFGAFIHEQIGTSGDLQIARKLYEKAKEILFKNYGIYASFNSKHSIFKDKFKRFAQLGVMKVKQKYFSPTDYYKSLVTFLEQRIKKLKRHKRDNLFVFMQSDFIAPKVAKKITFPIPTALFVGKISWKKGMSFPQFVSAVLGAAHGTAPTISYELPMIEHRENYKQYVLVVKDQQGKVVKEEQLNLLEPLSEIAEETLDYKKAATYTKIGLRLASKHIAALYAAYEIYKKSGMLTATIAYALSNKAIEASEKADLRYWALLPHNVSVTSLHLGPGEYSLFIKVISGQQKDAQLIEWKSKIKIDHRTQMVDLRINH